MQDQGQPEMLPVELWLLVASFLAPDSLRNLCLVSKAFRLLTQPKLFRHYKQPGSSSDPCSLQPFIRVCLARPDLAAAVRKITVRDFSDHWKGKFTGPETTTSEWKRKYDFEIQRLANKGWPESEPNDHLTFARSLALLCSLILNVEHLILNLEYFPLKLGLEDPVIGWKLLGPFLPQLCHLQIDFINKEDYYGLRDFRLLIALPSLKTLQCHHVKDDENDDRGVLPGPLSMPRQLSIQHITLMCSEMTQDRLKELIEGCHTLKTFKLVYGDVTTNEVGSAEYDFDILSSAFLTHKACLESLTLDFESETITKWLEKNDIQGMMTMSSFECLRHIDLPAWGLFRFHQNNNDDENSVSMSDSTFLPSSLESLVIRSCDEKTVPALWELLSTLDALPNLTDIAFTGAPKANLDGLDGFEDACKEKHIELNNAKSVRPPSKVRKYC